MKSLWRCLILGLLLLGNPLVARPRAKPTGHQLPSANSWSKKVSDDPELQQLAVTTRDDNLYSTSRLNLLGDLGVIFTCPYMEGRPNEENSTKFWYIRRTLEAHRRQILHEMENGRVLLCDNGKYRGGSIQEYKSDPKFADRKLCIQRERDGLEDEFSYLDDTTRKMIVNSLVSLTDATLSVVDSKDLNSGIRRAEKFDLIPFMKKYVIEGETNPYTGYGPDTWLGFQDNKTPFKIADKTELEASAKNLNEIHANLIKQCLNYDSKDGEQRLAVKKGLLPMREKSHVPYTAKDDRELREAISQNVGSVKGLVANLTSGDDEKIKTAKEDLLSKTDGQFDHFYSDGTSMSSKARGTEAFLTKQGLLDPSGKDNKPKNLFQYLNAAAVAVVPAPPPPVAQPLTVGQQADLDVAEKMRLLRDKNSRPATAIALLDEHSKSTSSDSHFYRTLEAQIDELLHSKGWIIPEGIIVPKTLDEKLKYLSDTNAWDATHKLIVKGGPTPIRAPVLAEDILPIPQSVDTRVAATLIPIPPKPDATRTALVSESAIEVSPSGRDRAVANFNKRQTHAALDLPPGARPKAPFAGIPGLPKLNFNQPPQPAQPVAPKFANAAEFGAVATSALEASVTADLKIRAPSENEAPDAPRKLLATQVALIEAEQAKYRGVEAFNVDNLAFFHGNKVSLKFLVEAIKKQLLPAAPAVVEVAPASTQPRTEPVIAPIATPVPLVKRPPPVPTPPQVIPTATPRITSASLPAPSATPTPVHATPTPLATPRPVATPAPIATPEPVRLAATPAPKAPPITVAKLVSPILTVDEKEKKAVQEEIAHAFESAGIVGDGKETFGQLSEDNIRQALDLVVDLGGLKIKGEDRFTGMLQRNEVGGKIKLNLNGQVISMKELMAHDENKKSMLALIRSKNNDQNFTFKIGEENVLIKRSTIMGTKEFKELLGLGPKIAKIEQPIITANPPIIPTATNTGSGAAPLPVVAQILPPPIEEAVAADAPTKQRIASPTIPSVERLAKLKPEDKNLEDLSTHITKFFASDESNSDVTIARRKDLAEQIYNLVPSPEAKPFLAGLETSLRAKGLVHGTDETGQKPLVNFLLHESAQGDGETLLNRANTPEGLAAAKKLAKELMTDFKESYFNDDNTTGEGVGEMLEHYLKNQIGDKSLWDYLESIVGKKSAKPAAPATRKPASTSEVKLSPEEQTFATFISKEEMGGDITGKNIPEKIVEFGHNEPFPSLGMGHYIWYPKGTKGPYEESFPKFREFLQQQGVTDTPPILMNADGAPWKNNGEFAKDRATVGAFLARKDIVKYQVMFQKQTIDTTLARKEFDTLEIRDFVSQLRLNPRGYLALTDYINFKGKGTWQTDSTKENPIYESYPGIEGWGLLQVLEEASKNSATSGADALKKFKVAAEKVLRARAANATKEKNVEVNGKMKSHYEIDNAVIDSWVSRLGRY